MRLLIKYEHRQLYIYLIPTLDSMKNVLILLLSNFSYIH